METITVEINVKQLEKAIEKISPDEQERLERRLWALRMDNLITKMRKTAQKNKIAEKEIRKVCEDVRQETYEKKTKDGN